VNELIQELMDWSNAAAQELQELLDSAEECGTEMPGVQALLDEHSDLINALNGF